jgi:hypothetical protein
MAAMDDNILPTGLDEIVLLNLKWRKYQGQSCYFSHGPSMAVYMHLCIPGAELPVGQGRSPYLDFWRNFLDASVFHKQLA